MKALVASIILFLILVSVIVFNIFYVKNFAKAMTEFIEQTDIGKDNSTIEELSEFWAKHKCFLAFSVGHDELDKLGELIIKLDNAHKSGNAELLKTNKELILDELAVITRYENFSIEAVF